jgi:hypothetical protein
MRPIALALCLMAGVALPCAAQQLEVNDAGGSMTRGTVNPIPGCPFNVSPSSGVIDFRVGGGATSGYILVMGPLAATSTQIALLDNQYYDISIPGTTVIGDGIGFTGSLPPALFVTNALGQSNWNIPANPLLTGIQLAFQAIVFDAAHTLGLNFTAAINFSFNAGGGAGVPAGVLIGSIQGDDVGFQANLTTPITFYGTAYSQLNIASNGYVRFAAGTGSSLGETTASFMAGTPGGVAAAPMIAGDWEDLNMIVANGGVAQCYEDTTPGSERVTVRYLNGNYYGGIVFGTLDIIIDINANGAGGARGTLDYGGYNPATAPSEGIVGVSDGNNGSGVNTQFDFFQFCPNPTVQGYLSTQGETIFQNFDGTGSTPAEAIDVGGHQIVFDDLTGTGTWFVSLF